MSFQSVIIGLSKNDFPDDGSGTPAVTIDRLLTKFAPAFEKKNRESTNPNMPAADIENVLALASLLGEYVDSASELAQIKMDTNYELTAYSPAIAMSLDGQDLILKYGNDQELVVTAELAERLATLLIVRTKGVEGKQEPYGVAVPIEAGGFVGQIPVRLKKTADSLAKAKFFASCTKGRKLQDVRDAIAPASMAELYDNYLPIGTVLSVATVLNSSKDVGGGKSIPQFVFLLANGQGVTLDEGCFSRGSKDQLSLLGLSAEDGGVEVQTVVKVDIVPQRTKEGQIRYKNDGVTPWTRSLWVAPVSPAQERMILGDLKKRNNTIAA